MSTLVVSNISDGSSTIGITSTSKGTAKAWVNFNGTGTVAIRASYNVSSITDNSTGNYTVNFTTPMNNVNYCCQVSAGNAAVGSQGSWSSVYDVSTNLTVSTRLAFYANAGATQDQEQAFLTVYSN